MIKQRNDNLTKEQELELGRKVQNMRSYTQEEGYDYEMLSQEEKLLVNEGFEAMEILVGNYINLARDIVHKHHKKTGTRYEFEDLLQDAISALIEATCSYDPDKNCRLSTHAFYGITKRVSSTINYQRLVRLPENKMGNFVEITRSQREYQNLSEEDKKKYKNELDFVYKNTKVKKEDVDIILTNMQPQVSLNAVMFENKGEILDTLKDESSERELKKVEKIDPNLERILKYLNEYQLDLIAFEFEVIEPSMSYADFMAKFALTERDFSREIRRVVTYMSNLAKKKGIKVTI